MWLILFRAFVVALLAHAGWYSPFPAAPGWGALGLIAAIGLIALEQRSPRAGAPGGGAGRRRHRPVAARLVWGALAGLDIVGAALRPRRCWSCSSATSAS